VLWRRFLTGCVAVPILMLTAWDRGWLFLAAVFGAGLLGTSEAIAMARHGGHRPLAAISYLLTIAVMVSAAVATPGGVGETLGLGFLRTPLSAALGLLVSLALAALLPRSDHKGSLTDWALSLALPLYVAGLVQFFIPLRERPDAGPFFLTWPGLVLITSWACDIAAFFVGRAWGRARLAPLISPAKSREGALAGVLAATAVGASFTLATQLDLVRMAGFGLAVGVGSVLGDLAESLLKRQTGVKDSGSLMPGHGGILDRMDALIFAAAVAYFYLEVVA
jgi:phosphatidate cytidylyltransferase